MAITSTVTYDDEIYELKIKNKKAIGEFQAIGRLHGMNDIFNALCSVSKSAFLLFNDLKETRDYRNNLCYIDTSGYTNSQRTLYQKRIKELKDANIIKKAKTIDLKHPVKKGSFMINPHFIKCVYDPEGSEANWDILT